MADQRIAELNNAIIDSITAAQVFSGEVLELHEDRKKTDSNDFQEAVEEIDEDLVKLENKIIEAVSSIVKNSDDAFALANSAFTMDGRLTIIENLIEMKILNIFHSFKLLEKHLGYSTYYDHALKINILLFEWISKSSGIVDEDIVFDQVELQRRKDLIAQITDIDLPNEIISMIDLDCKLVDGGYHKIENIGTCTEAEKLALKLLSTISASLYTVKDYDIKFFLHKEMGGLLKVDVDCLALLILREIENNLENRIMFSVAERLEMPKGQFFIIDSDWEIFLTETPEEGKIQSKTHGLLN